MRYRYVAVLFVLLLLLSMGGAAPTQAQISREALNHALVATVQIFALDDDMNVIGSGSGSIVDPRGVILTNFHVVGDLRRGKLANSDGLVGIALTQNPRRPAVPTFIGEFVEGDPELDLAIIRLVADLEGNELSACPDLPAFEVGDADAVQVGDELAIIGFPGIGGSSVTFTRGTVSGFESDETGEAAWIKTDAEINPGNSGGAAVFQDGTLVGVPSQVVVDEQTGAGQLGRLRPISFIAERLRDLSDIEIAGCDGSSSPRPPRPDAPATPGNPRASKHLTGVIISADSGRPVRDGLVVILTPGITWDTADLDNPDHIYDVMHADRDGQFESNEPVDLNTRYSIGAGGEGYRDLLLDDVVFSEYDDGAATVSLEISLKRE